MTTTHSTESKVRRPATGPRTAQGKSRSSLNALRHGLTGQVVVMPGEDLETYQRHCRAAFADLTPQGFRETQLVQAIADLAWRLLRARTFENNLLALTHHATAPKFTITEENSEGSSAATALASAAAFQSLSEDLARISLYEQRLHRQYAKSQADLERLQTIRRAAEQQALEEAALLKSAHDEDAAVSSHRLGRPAIAFDPAAYQFVLSNTEIDAHIRRHNALQRARHRFQRSDKTFYAAA